MGLGAGCVRCSVARPTGCWAAVCAVGVDAAVGALPEADHRTDLYPAFCDVLWP